jgi:hypothetical protein
VEDAIAHVHLAIELGSEPISGSVGASGEVARRFDGWIELTAAIERARSQSRVATAEPAPTAGS